MASIIRLGSTHSRDGARLRRSLRRSGFQVRTVASDAKRSEPMRVDRVWPDGAILASVAYHSARS